MAKIKENKPWSLLQACIPNKKEIPLWLLLLAYWLLLAPGVSLAPGAPGVSHHHPFEEGGIPFKYVREIPPKPSKTKGKASKTPPPSVKISRGSPPWQPPLKG